MKPYLIGIAGPSGAGKSTFCKVMTATFEGVSRLKLDDFFKDINDVPKINGAINWDHPSSIKWHQLIKAAYDLKNKKYALVPNYDRAQDKAIGEKCVFPSQIILVDGFMALCEPRLRELLDLSLFFRLSEDSQIKRRKERQPWVEDQYLNHVMIPSSRELIMPSAEFADFVINAEISKQGVSDICINIIRQKLKDRIKKLERRRMFQTTTIKAKV